MTSQTAASLIVETGAGQLFSVRENVDAGLDHVWVGIAVKRVNGAYLPKAKARPILIRKIGCRVIGTARVLEVA